jgi:hypothetical protein
VRFRTIFLAIGLLGCTSGANAQGSAENYHFEFGMLWWKGSPEIVLSGGADGSPVDYPTTFLIDHDRFRDMKIVAKAGRNKFRYGSLPVEYTATTVLTDPIVFQGQEYPAGASVTSVFNWTQRRVGYEFDAVANAGGYFGAFIDFNFNTANVKLTGPLPAGEQTLERTMTVPTVGGAFRGYVASKSSVTAEFTIVKFRHENTEWKFGDFDAYLTSNFGRNFGALLGFRRLTSDFPVDPALGTGSLKLKGPYLGFVARF